MQLLQHQHEMRNIEDMIEAVENASYRLNLSTLFSVFLTLQHCMPNTMTVDRSNRYQMPYMWKSSLRSNGYLPAPLNVSLDEYTNTMLRIRVAELTAENNRGKVPSESIQ